ncbi:hypothetical protein BGZ58_011295 [Dissophora ornata]|nr:hypothetical protein BGZ58_011295 [Dissophora ornata]
MTTAGHDSGKVTHAGRKAGAQYAQDSGAGLEEIVAQGNLDYIRMVIYHMHSVAELISNPDWPKRVETVMMDFPEEVNRSLIQRQTIPNKL